MPNRESCIEKPLKANALSENLFENKQIDSS